MNIFLILIFIVIQLQLCAFSPHPSTPPQLKVNIFWTMNIFACVRYYAIPFRITEVNTDIVFVFIDLTV